MNPTCSRISALLGVLLPTASLTFAATPPMGWNSWDVFGTALTETQAKAQADVLADKRLPRGWNIFTVEIQ